MWVLGAIILAVGFLPAHSQGLYLATRNGSVCWHRAWAAVGIPWQAVRFSSESPPTPHSSSSSCRPLLRLFLGSCPRPPSASSGLLGTALPSNCLCLPGPCTALSQSTSCLLLPSPMPSFLFQACWPPRHHVSKAPQPQPLPSGPGGGQVLIQTPGFLMSIIFIPAPSSELPPSLWHFLMLSHCPSIPKMSQSLPLAATRARQRRY